MRPSEAVRVEEITSLAGLEALRDEWRALWARVPDATPFGSPDWLVPWWRHIGEGELLTLAYRGPDGALAAVLPFYVYRQPGGTRTLFPIGIATTDYLDAMVAPAARAAVLPRIVPDLAARADRWDMGEWPQLRPGAALLAAPAPPGWRDDRDDAEPCPVLDLSRGLDGMPTEQRESLVRRRARALKKGAVTYERATEATAAEVLDAHLRLHAARWEKRGEDGVLAAARVQAMHREALPGLLRAGALRLYAMRLEGRIVATVQGFCDPPGRAARRVYFYLGGFDPTVERLSPGMLVVGFAVEDALAEGAVAVDFLRGQEAHKYAWGATDTPTFRRRLTPP